jgi:uncharacterized membrane protein
MASVTQHVDVSVPVSVAYNQWTQFEEFPRFMEGVKNVEQLDDKHLRWHAEIAGKDEQWTSEITEQRPDERIAWRSTSGAKSAGVVTFHHLGEGKSRVTLQMEYEPQGGVEKAGSAVGIVETRTKGDLKRFKEFVESRGRETGAWRGKIEH